jgi:hypothetical protein
MNDWLNYNKYADVLQGCAIRKLIDMDAHCWEFRIYDSHRDIATQQKRITEILRPPKPQNPDKDGCPRRLAVPR